MWSKMLNRRNKSYTYLNTLSFGLTQSNLCTSVKVAN
jgi:hypothetical protein